MDNLSRTFFFPLHFKWKTLNLNVLSFPGNVFVPSVFYRQSPRHVLVKMARSFPRSEEVWLGTGYYLLPLREPAASAILYQDWFYNCGGYSGLSTQLQLELWKPKPLGTPERNYFLKNKIHEAGRATFGPDHLRGEDPAFIQATPAGIRIEQMEEGSSLSGCLLSLALASLFLHWH